MFHHYKIRTLFLGLAVGLCLSASVSLAREKKTKEEKREQQEEKRSEKEEKKHLQQEKQYATLTEFAQDYYATDPDFRDAVDRNYSELQRRHAEEAYHINTSHDTEIVVANGEQFELRQVLYPSPRLQDYVNRVGQALVPADSARLYAFKVTTSPIPYAYTLSTGTIYISTGLISMTDNEAQLAYVLSHELAHVHKDHWKMKVMSAMAESEYNRKQERKRAIWGAALGAGLGAAVGGLAGKSGESVAQGATLGALAGIAIGVFTSKHLNVDWDYAQENEADDFALKNALERNYDVQEVPKLYMTLNHAVTVDQRVGLGFMASGARIKDRMAYAQKQLQSTLKTDYEKKLNAAQLLGTSPDYQLMTAELKRDNGIWAFQFDMFDMAKKNLNQAVRLRNDDALACFYYGKVLKLVARNEDEARTAKDLLMKAIQLDEQRHFIPEAELERALMAMDVPGGSKQAEAAQALKNYVQDYQAQRLQQWGYFDSVPANMPILYDYLRLLGEQRWQPPTPELVRMVPTGAGAAGTNRLSILLPGSASAGVLVKPVKAEKQLK